MAIRPDGMLACRGACRVEEALLGQQHVGTLCMLAPPDGALGVGNLSQGTTNMYGSSTQACLRFPGDRAIQRDVHFADTWAIAVALKLVLVALRQLGMGNAQQLARGDITEDGMGRGQHLQRLYLHASDDLSSQCVQVGSHRINNALRAAARNGPANSVPQHTQRQTKRRADRRLQREHGVGRDPGYQSAGTPALKAAFCHPAYRANGLQTKTEQD